MHIPPNWGTFFALIVSFLVFWFIFGRIFFRPLLKLLEKREGRFKEMSERTEQLVTQARAAEDEREQRLSAMRREANSRREAERRTAEAETSREIEQAKEEARESLEKVRERIGAELEEAEKRLDEMGRNLASELAQRVLGRPLNGAGKNVSN